MSLAELVQVLLDFSERAAVLARSIRKEESLFKLLVEEKTGDQKNKRFKEDFKTLTDVVIQQALCHYLARKFPVLEGHIHGEESAKFSNTDGETITVQIQDTEKATADLFQKILGDNEDAANKLAHHLHVPNIECSLKVDTSTTKCTTPLEELAVWIDPIDSTGEYIRGDPNTHRENLGQEGNGLWCVTILIGVFRRHSPGSPVAGVVNQPYGEINREGVASGQSSVYWGISNDLNSIPGQLTQREIKSTPQVAYVSSSEKVVILQALQQAGITTVPMAGAGYKCLSVITGEADLYVYSKSSTYMWDTCGPHAILLSMGGGMITFDQLRHIQNDEQPELPQLQYVEKDDSVSSIDKYCNSKGLIAYRKVEHVHYLAKILKNVSLT